MSGGDASEELLDVRKVFAEECQEMFADFTQELLKAETLVATDQSVQSALLSEMRRQLEAILGSAEFLQVHAVAKPCESAIAFLENLIPNPEQFGRQELNLVVNLFNTVDGVLSKIADGQEVLIDDQLNSLIRDLDQHTAEHTKEPPEAAQQDPADEEASLFIDDGFKITITPEMLETFITEAHEQLETVEDALLSMEKDLNDTESLNLAFRGIHSFKGNCGLFNYADLERLGHDFESILEEFKMRNRPCDRNGITVLLKVLDILKTSMENLQETEGKVENLELYLDAMRNYDAKGKALQGVVKDGQATLLGEILVEQGFISREGLDEAVARQGMSLGEILLDMEVVSESQLRRALMIQRERRQVHGKADGKRKATNTQNIRVDLDKLDQLMNLVGELIIAENMVCQNPDLDGVDAPNFRKSAIQLNRISREIQDVSMLLRMIPIDATFRKMNRVVRDVAVKRGKHVHLEIKGEDTEVDKSIVESISDPLLHLIRNAIDHGIEMPDIRKRKGKPETGTVRLEAYHQSGEICIGVHDDGAGISAEKVLAKAMERGLTEPGVTYSEAEIFELIFEPGFSTAERVTDISGRGVGMDVVKQSLEKIRGKIEVSSTLGKGTSFRLRIPLTLAIIDGMLVRIGRQQFTIPLLSIQESLQACQKSVTRTLSGGELLMIRGQLIPVMRLHRYFNLRCDFTRLEDGIVVVIEHQKEFLCLFVDEIMGQCQAVIKGLSDYLGLVKGVAGSSILSDGDISLILDVPALIEASLNGLPRGGLSEA